MSNLLYRITLNGKGIYSAIKEQMNQDEWHNFLNYNTWLPNPGKELYESNECISFFTQKGYIEFMKRTSPFIYPLFCISTVEVIPDTNENLLYSDRYQKVFKKE